MSQTNNDQFLGLVSTQNQPGTDLSSFYSVTATAGHPGTDLSLFLGLTAYGPLSSPGIANTAFSPIMARAGITEIQVSDMVTLVAYGTGQPLDNRQQAWTFTLDGHKLYVLPLGPEGDWAYDITTQSWSQLKTNGFDGLNFTKGVMWGPRIIGGDLLYPYLYEMDPNERLDEEWRPITHIVTGGIPLRGRFHVGVSNFTVTASTATLDDPSGEIIMSFSDDNGKTWSPDFGIQLDGSPSQDLIWNSLGSFSAPGRIIKVTDEAGPIRIDGADIVLNYPQGVDSGERDQ